MSMRVGPMTDACAAAARGGGGHRGGRNIGHGHPRMDFGDMDHYSRAAGEPRIPPNSCVPGAATFRCPTPGACTLWAMKWWNGKKHMRLYYLEGRDDPSMDFRHLPETEVICGSNYRGGEFTIGWNGSVSV